MYRIRDRQLQPFREIALAQLETDIVEHLHTYFPVDVELLGENQTRRVIRHGMERARAHDFTTKGTIIRYVDLSLGLGGHFDRDPLLPWARTALMRRPDEPPLDRMERFSSVAFAHLDDTAGEKGEYFMRAMLRLQHIRWQDVPGVDSAGDRHALLSRIYPAKWTPLGREERNSFDELLLHYAVRHGLRSPRAKAVLATVMFMLGSHVLEDPQFPWALEASLRDAKIDGIDQGRALYDAAQNYLERGLALLRERARN